MANKRNYQRELEQLIEMLAARGELGRTLLLHSCCAPCSSYCLEYLRAYFRITVFYYNPNISMETEYQKRVAEQRRVITTFNRQGDAYPVDIIEETYCPQEFYSAVRGIEECPEGGARCFSCYELRLCRTAQEAQRRGFDYFATTLTISPLKNAVKINEIGERLSMIYGVNWLVSDFKKKDGYKRSVELSAKYDLYRQDYCGCIFSLNEKYKKSCEENKKTV